jgi:hypothetical protein
MLDEGLLRIAIACVLALPIGGPEGTLASPGVWTAYLAAGLAAAYGALLAAGRPGTVLGNRLAGLLLVSSLVTGLVASTAGKARRSFPCISWQGRGSPAYPVSCGTPPGPWRSRGGIR